MYVVKSYYITYVNTFNGKFGFFIWLQFFEEE